MLESLNLISYLQLSVVTVVVGDRTSEAVSCFAESGCSRTHFTDHVEITWTQCVEAEHESPVHELQQSGLTSTLS